MGVVNKGWGVQKFLHYIFRRKLWKIKKENIRITRCYLVEYIDKYGKQIDSDFCFGTKADAEKLGIQLKDNYRKINHKE